MRSAAKERGRCFDIDDIARPLRRTGSDIHQLGHGPLCGEYHHVQLRGAWMQRVALNRTVHAFNVRPSHHSFVLIIAANAGTRFCGHHLSAGQICVNVPGKAWDFLLSGEWLRIELTDDSPTRNHSESSAQTELSVDTPKIFDPKSGVFTQLLNQASRLLSEVPNDSSAEGGAEQEMLGLLKQSPPSTGTDCQQFSRSAQNHRRVVLQAHEFMIDHIARPVTVNEVCSALDISERTLRYAFHYAFELSPMAYFKLMRLNAVHSEFKAHDRSTITVHEVAERFGFDHLGAFAADYRKLFGVYPSETLAPVHRSPSGG